MSLLSSFKANGSRGCGSTERLCLGQHCGCFTSRNGSFRVFGRGAVFIRGGASGRLVPTDGCFPPRRWLENPRHHHRRARFRMPRFGSPTPGQQVRSNGGVSELTRRALWARAAGRCQYAGCNKSLIGDLISGAEDRNFGFVAHVTAASSAGPRGNSVWSELLANNITNLMLLCYVHHKLIDVDQIERHPEDRLLAMKAAHEARIETEPYRVSRRLDSLNQATVACS